MKETGNKIGLFRFTLCDTHLKITSTYQKSKNF